MENNNNKRWYLFYFLYEFFSFFFTFAVKKDGVAYGLCENGEVLLDDLKII